MIAFLTNVMSMWAMPDATSTRVDEFGCAGCGFASVGCQPDVLLARLEDLIAAIRESSGASSYGDDWPIARHSC